MVYLYRISSSISLCSISSATPTSRRPKAKPNHKKIRKKCKREN